MSNGKASAKADKLIGIVDPFLPTGPYPGQMFWLVLYPRTITSLRHVWEHPDFITDPVRSAVPRDEVNLSIQWIKDYCSNIGCTMDELMEHAELWVESTKNGGWGEYWVDGGRWEGMSVNPEFWGHYEVVRGQTVPTEQKRNFFSCAC
jgi:hypothetical protein